MSRRHILVVGAGAWGTALAVHCHRIGHHVTLWARNPQPLLETRRSPRLPDVLLPDAIQVTGTLPGGADCALLVVPVAYLRATLGLALPQCPLVLCMKGLEPGTHLLPAEVAATRPTAILSGPNFAHEVAAGLPAAAVLATADAGQRSWLMGALGSPTLRLYGSGDVIGAQVGGAAKNVIAIAAGTAIGLGLGENARAAVVTRGLAEMARLAEALGGRRDTVAGLSGMGDLLLTCTGAASRNYRYGLYLGQGQSAETARTAIDGTVEGIGAAAGLLARAAQVDRPLVTAVHALTTGGIAARDAVATLLARPQRDEPV